MADYRTLVVDVSTLDEGKFYKIYTDSNGTTLLIPKETDDNLSEDVRDNRNRIITLENENTDVPMSITNSPNAVINIINDNNENNYKRIDVIDASEIVIPYKGIISSIKVYDQIPSSTTDIITFEQIEEGVLIKYVENNLTKDKQIIINTNSPITGYVEVFSI